MPGSFIRIDSVEKLVGRKIVEAKSTNSSLVLKLDDGTELEFMETGRPGADSSWYTFPVLKQNGTEIWHG